MKIARVVGSAVATAKLDGLAGSMLLIVEETTPDGEPIGLPFVAVDGIGSGTGESVLIATGSAARAIDGGANRPTDALIVGILILVWPLKTAIVVTAMIAVYAIITGIVYVGLAIFSKTLGGWSRVGHAVLGVLFVIAGIVAFFNLTETTLLVAVFVVRSVAHGACCGPGRSSAA